MANTYRNNNATELFVPSAEGGNIRVAPSKAVRGAYYADFSALTLLSGGEESAALAADPNYIVYEYTTDSQGTSGWSGYSGSNGASGTSGYSGRSGYSGQAGGDSGISGWSGYSGGTGSNGAPGLPGTSGYSGRNGTSGYSGKSGYSGANGESGYSGIGTADLSHHIGPVRLAFAEDDYSSLTVGVSGVDSYGIKARLIGYGNGDQAARVFADSTGDVARITLEAVDTATTDNALTSITKASHSTSVTSGNNASYLELNTTDINLGAESSTSTSSVKVEPRAVTVTLAVPNGKLHIEGLSGYDGNAAARTGGLVTGDFYILNSTKALTIVVEPA